MKKMTWAEMCDYMWKYNEEHNIRAKGASNHYVYGVAVISADSFTKEYSLESRSYKFSNHNKAFIAGQSSNSIFASALDGTDDGVRLDWYIHNGWHIEYCYLEEAV